MHLIYLAVGIEWIDGMVFVSNASVAARFELAFQTNTVSCIIGIIPTEFQTTRFNWIKPRPTRNQLTSTCLSTPFLIPFRIINLSPSINRRQRHRLHQNSLPSSSFSSVQSNLERIFFNDTIHTHTHYSKKLSSNPWISDKEQVPILRSTSTSSNLNENPLLETLHRGKRSYIKVNPLRLVRT